MGLRFEGSDSGARERSNKALWFRRALAGRRASRMVSWIGACVRRGSETASRGSVGVWGTRRADWWPVKGREYWELDWVDEVLRR